MKKIEIYVVSAYRWGDREEHSYILGVFSDKHKAQITADEHCQYRGGKYACVVESCIVDGYNEDDDCYVKEIYRAKSMSD